MIVFCRWETEAEQAPLALPGQNWKPALISWLLASGCRSKSLKLILAAPI